MKKLYKSVTHFKITFKELLDPEFLRTEYLLQNSPKFCIPIWQRDYDWGDNQIDSFFKGLENMSQEQPFHLGNIILMRAKYKKGKITETDQIFYIVDGQQRIRSLHKFYKMLLSNESKKISLHPVSLREHQQYRLFKGKKLNLYSDKKAGNDPTEIFAIREYAPGDKIRNIHWKISAKMGQTMVKDYGLPLFEKDTVIIEKFSNKNVSVANEIYDLLYSLIYAMTQRGFGLNVCFVNGIYTEKRIENETDIHNLFAELYQSDSKDDVNVAEIYYAGHDKSSNRIFYVTDVLDKISMGRMDILKERGPVYYLIPKSRGGGEYLIKYD